MKMLKRKGCRKRKEGLSEKVLFFNNFSKGYLNFEKSFFSEPGVIPAISWGFLANQRPDTSSPLVDHCTIVCS
jgi:hypothetical protein